VELVPFPINIKIKVRGSGQECPLHTIYAIRGELPDVVVVRMSVQGDPSTAHADS
jgi:hypothetical protein